MSIERIRLSERARKKLFALSEQADLEPSFLLEYLINKHGSEAIQTLTGHQGSLVSLTNTNQPNKDSLVTLTDTNDPIKDDLVTQTDTKKPSNTKKPRPPITGLFDD